MNTRRLFLLRASAGLCTVPSLLAGCGTGVLAPPLISRLNIYAAGKGSAFLPYAETLAKSLTSRGVPTFPIESGGSIDNVRRVDADTGGSALATVFLGTAHEAVTGAAAWTQGTRFTNLRALFPMYETSFQCVALSASGISTVADLNGKRVGVGPAGGPAENYFKGLATVAGISMQLVNGTPASLVTDLIASRIDALWQGASVPIPAIQQVTAAHPAIVFGLTPGQVDGMLKAFSALSPATVAADTYRGQSTALSSVSAWNFVMANQNMSDSLVTWLLQSVFNENAPLAMHASARATRITDAANNRVVPFHPAARRFYENRKIL
jgi:uncharacterized protein